MSEIYSGCKVICVDNAPHTEWSPNIPPHRCDADKWLEVGKTYTIDKIVQGKDHTLVWLLEVNRRTDEYSDSGFSARRFRPLDSKAISIFRQIARDVTDGVQVQYKDPIHEYDGAGLK